MNYLLPLKIYINNSFSIPRIIHLISNGLFGFNCYKIINRSSRKALTVRKGSLANGAIVTQTEYNDLLNQKWRIDRTDDGTYSIYSLNSLKPIEPSSSYLGTSVIQKDTTSNLPNGSWKIECTNRQGYYKLKSLKNRDYLDIMARSTATGAQAITWYWTDTYNQYWQIMPVNCNTETPGTASITLEAREEYKVQDDAQLSVYPNPAHDEIHIQLNAHSNEPLTIYDRLGRIVFQTKNNDSNTFLKINLSPDRFKPGMYVIVAGSNSHFRTKIFIVD